MRPKAVIFWSCWAAVVVCQAAFAEPQKTKLELARELLNRSPADYAAAKTHVDSTLTLGADLEAAGKKKTAYDLYAHALKFWPNHPQVLERYAHLKALGGALVDAPDPQISEKPEEKGGKTPEEKPAEVNKKLENETIRSRSAGSEKGKPEKKPEPPRRKEPQPSRTVSTTPSVPGSRSEPQKGMSSQGTPALQSGVRERDSVVQYNSEELSARTAALRWWVTGLSVVLGLVLPVMGWMVFRGHRPPREGALAPVPGAANIASRLADPASGYRDIRSYIPELEASTRLLLIQKIEELIRDKSSSVTPAAALEALFPFLTDGVDFIRDKSRALLGTVLDHTIESPGENPDPHFRVIGSDGRTREYPLRYLAEFADQKTNRPDHSRKVSRLAGLLAREMDLSETEVTNVTSAGMLMDVGLMQLSDSVFRENRPLTEAEKAQLHRHPDQSIELVQSAGLAHSALSAIKHHHERWDGAGYPAGLAGESIPLGARILALSDAYAAMTSFRPHKAALQPAQVVRELEKNAGSQFDPEVFRALLSLIARKTHQRTA